MLYPVLQDPLRPVVSSLFDRPVGLSIRQMLFGAGEQGGWYDVSDMSTLFQDSAGTVPVTAVEQPVGLILDKSGLGNHATQATTTKRPVLSRRVNLLTKTEDLSNAAWAKDSVNTTAVSLGAGETRINFANGGTAHRVSQAVTYSAPANTGITIKCKIKAFNAANVGKKAIFRSQNSMIGFLISSEVTLTTDFIEVVLSGASTSATTVFDFRFLDFGLTDPATDFVVKDLQLTLAIDSHLPYQRVNTSTDYDEDPAKFPAYLRFDGVDDALQTGNINFTGTDKMTVWAGVTKLSDAGLQMISELSIDAGFTNGSFWLLGGNNSVGTSGWGARTGGTTRPSMVGADSLAPINSVLTLTSDISGSVSNMRSNGALKATATSTHGTGSFVSAPLFIGARAGTSLYFNGRLYSLIVRGAQSTLSQIEATEAYIKQKMRLS